MSIQEKKEEADAILDSAEMILETYGSRGEAARELERKVNELSRELEDPESEKSLQKLIDDIQELMEDMQQEPADEPMIDGEGMGMGPEEPGDDMPPI